MDALVQAGVDVGLGGQIWMGVGLPYAPRRHSPYGGGPPGRHRGRLSKGTKVTHDPLIKVSCSRARHLKSCMEPFLDAIARVEQKENELAGFVPRTNGDYKVCVSVRSDRYDQGIPVVGDVDRHPPCRLCASKCHGDPSDPRVRK